MEEFEDEWEDLVHKANYEQTLSPQEVSALINRKAFTALSHHLKLNEQKLSAFAKNKAAPLKVNFPNLERIIAPFGKFTVNIWLLKSNGASFLIDTGTRSREVEDLAQKNQLTPQTNLLITHLDDDHVGGNEYLESRFLRRVPFPASSNSQFEVIPTPGHRKEHFAYYFPEEKICFCGDALFSCSMGRPNYSLRASRLSLEALLSLPEDTMLCPGHGSATTVLFERTNNPFFLG